MQLPRVTALLPLVLVTALAACTGHHGMMGSGPSSGTATAGAGASSAARLAAQDLAFATTAAGSGMYEVEISRIAVGKASNAAVRNYAQMLVNHHTMANNELMALLRAKGMAPPAAIPPDKQARIAQLSGMSPVEFDRQYIRMVGIQDHMTDIAQFEQGQRAAADADLKGWIVKTLPTLRAHLQQAQTIAGSLAG